MGKIRNVYCEKLSIEQFCCLNSECLDYMKYDNANLQFSGYSNGNTDIRLIRCNTCGKRFSERKGTPIFGARTPTDKSEKAIELLKSGKGVLQTARELGLDKDTAARFYNKLYSNDIRVNNPSRKNKICVKTRNKSTSNKPKHSNQDNLLSQKVYEDLKIKNKTNTISIHSIMKAFETIKDPRNPSGKRYKLSSIMTLCTISMMCGLLDNKAIVSFGKNHPKLCKILEFKDGIAPSEATLSRIFQILPKHWYKHIFHFLNKDQQDSIAIAIDGKVIRGSKEGDKKAKGIVTAFSHDGKTILWSEEIMNCNELEAVHKSLKEINLKDKIITADALSTQKSICSFIDKQDGYYLRNPAK